MNKYLIILVGIIAGCACNQEKSKVDALMALAKGTDTTQNWKGSINYYSQVLQIDSSHWKALLFRSDAYSEIGDDKASITDLNRLIEIIPGALSYCERARYYLKKRDIKNAHADLLKSLQFDSTYGQSWYELSSINSMLNRPDSAIAYLEKAERLRYSPTYSHIIRSTLALNNNDFETVIKETSALLKLDHSNGAGFNNRGYAKIRLSRYEDAVGDIDMAIRLVPGMAFAYNNKATILFHLNQPEKALDFVNKSLTLDSLNAFAYKNRAEIFLALRDGSKACKDLGMALHLVTDPNLLSEINELSKAYCGKTN